MARIIRSSPSSYLQVLIEIVIMYVGYLIFFIIGQWVLYDTSKSFIRNMITWKNMLAILVLAGLTTGLYYVVKIYQENPDGKL